MRPFKVLHKGFDGLDMAFLGALRAADIAILEDARKQAEQTHQPALVEIGPGKVAVHVADTGARGGYAFRCDTGPTGETWFFKRGQSANDWNIRVSAKSLPLALFGYKGVRDQIHDKLAQMGALFGDACLSRIDFAMDFLMPVEFSLNPSLFVAHSRSTTSERNYAMNPEEIDPNEFHVVWSGRQASSVTIGKMPGRQIIVYDKRHEVIQKQKFHWFDIWGIDSNDDNYAVWRVEARAGKKFLRFWKIRNFTDLENQIGDLLVKSLEDIRYVLDIGYDSNISRRPVDPFWKFVQQEMGDALAANRSGIIPDNIIQGERQKIMNRYKSQIISLVPGALIASGLPAQEAEKEYAALFAELAEKIEKDGLEQFRKKIDRATKRLHFI